jgi:drug/metabolite transporter (DMT)-like permease
MVKNANAYLKYIVALLLFGSNGIVASHIALSSYDIVFTRTLIGSLFLILIFVLSKQKAQFWKNKAHLLYLVFSGVAMGASWMFLYEAYVRIGVSLATLAYYCGPIIVMVLSPLLFRERMASAKLLGFLAVVIGMLCVNGQALLQGSARGTARAERGDWRLYRAAFGAPFFGCLAGGKDEPAADHRRRVDFRRRCFWRIISPEKDGPPSG